MYLKIKILDNAIVLHRLMDCLVWWKWKGVLVSLYELDIFPLIFTLLTWPNPQILARAFLTMFSLWTWLQKPFLMNAVNDIDALICNDCLTTSCWTFCRYVEFYDAMSVPMAIALSGQPLLGIPVMVKPSEAEKNLVQSTTSAASASGGSIGPYSGGARRLYVGNLHSNLTSDQLRKVKDTWTYAKFALQTLRI